MIRTINFFLGMLSLSLLFSLNAMADCWKCPCPSRPYTYQTEYECTVGCPSGLACFGYSYCDQISGPECLPPDQYEFLYCNGAGYEILTEDEDFICAQPDNVCEGQIGGPVNLANGSMWYRPKPDVILNNPFPFEVQRAYWSISSERDHARNILQPMGWGWRINFYEWMEIRGSEHNLVGIHRWNGALDRFYIRPGGGSWIPEDGKRQTLSGGATSYQLIDADGISRIYQGTEDKLVMTSMGPAGVPEQGVEICYSETSSPSSDCICGEVPDVDNGSKPCQLKPASGPAIDIHWTSISNQWMISALSIGNETIAAYEYDSNNNLQKYYRGDTNSSENWIYSYTYLFLSNVQTPPVSTGGARIDAETHEWDCSDGACRVTQTQTPTSDYFINYGPLETTVINNKLNPPVEYTVTFNEQGRPLTMSPANGCRSPIAEYRYDDKEIERNGVPAIRHGANVRAIKYADNSWTSYTLDLNGDPIKIRIGDNDDNAETPNMDAPAPAAIEMTWHPSQMTPLSISRDGLLSSESLTVFDYEDPETAIPCSPGNCSTSLGKANFNQNTLKNQLQRIIRFGTTKNASLITQREAHVQEFSYDSEGRLWKIAGPLSDQLTTLEYWGNSEPTNKKGRLKSRKTRVTTTAELVTTFNDYDIFGNPLSVTFTRSPKNNSTELDETWLLTYEKSRLKTIQNPNGKIWTYNYTPLGTVESIVSPKGNATKNSYDTDGLLSAIGRYPSLNSSSAWEETQLSYDNRGNTTKIEYQKNGATKRRSSYGYDDRDRLSREEIWRNNLSSPAYYKVYGYNLGWQIGTVTDANHATAPDDIWNANLKYGYYPSGELISVDRKNSNFFERETNISPDIHGNSNYISDAEGRATYYIYDDFDRLIEINGVMKVRYSYDAADRLTGRIETIHTGSYDSLGEPLANPEQISYQYDLSNRLIGKTGNGLQWSASFDSAPQTVTKCFGGGTVSLNHRGWRLSSITRNNTTLAFGYDISGKLVHEARKDSDKTCYHVFSKAYTDNGQLASLTYPSGRIVEYIYPTSPSNGDIDHPTQLKMTLGNVQTILLNNIIYEAGKPTQWTDSSGLRTSVTRNLDGTIADRKVEYCPTGGTCSTFFDWEVSGRDGVGNVTNLSLYPSNNNTAKVFSYTDRNELASGRAALLCASCDKFYLDYNNAGDRSQTTLKTYVLKRWHSLINEYTYNDSLLSQVYRPSVSITGRKTLTYQKASGDTRIAKAITKRLNQVNPQIPYLAWSARYTVDGFLDRLHHEADFDSNTGVAATNDYRYYSYDGLDRRSIRSTTESGIARIREFWNDHKIFAEIDVERRGTLTDTTIGKPKIIGYLWVGNYRDYIYLDNEAIAVADGDFLCISQTTTGACSFTAPASSLTDSNIYFIHKDHLGSAVLLTDTNRNEVLSISYNPFGEVTLTGDVEYNPRRPGQYQDNDFVYYNGYRYFEPATGRYLQPEPIFQNPQIVQAYAVAGYPLNAYAYAANNPLRFVDPTGLATTIFVTEDWGIGSHVAVLIDSGFNGFPLLYDPAGGYSYPGDPRTTADLFEGNGANARAFIDHHLKTGSSVRTIVFPTTPEEEAIIAENMLTVGSMPPFSCSIGVSNILDGVGAFKGLKNYWFLRFPGRLWAALVKQYRAQYGVEGGIQIWDPPVGP